jgi:hypothetical protein
VRPDADLAQVLSEVMFLGWGDGRVDDVEDGAQGNRVVEEIAQEFDDATQRAMADQHETEDQLTQPLLGDGQVKQDLVLRLLRGERIVEGTVGNSDLLVDELAADVEFVGQTGDGLGLGQRLQPDVEPLAGRQSLGGTTVGNCLLQSKGASRRIGHVCFLHETGGGAIPPVWGKQTFLESSIR